MRISGGTRRSHEPKSIALQKGEPGSAAKKNSDEQQMTKPENPSSKIGCKIVEKRGMTDHKTQDEPQWIVAQRLLSALTIPGFK